MCCYKYVTRSWVNSQIEIYTSKMKCVRDVTKINDLGFATHLHAISKHIHKYKTKVRIAKICGLFISTYAHM